MLRRLPPDLAAPIPVYLVSFLVLGVATAFLGPALDELRDRSGSGIGEIGVLFTVQAIGYFCGSQIASRLIERVAGHRVFASGLLAIGTGLALVPQIASVAGWVPAFVLIGLGTGSVDVGANVMLLWKLGPRSGRAMNTLHLSFGVGALSAPLLVYADIAWACRAVATTTVVLAAWAWTTPSPAAPATQRDEHVDATRRLLVLIGVFFFVYVGCEAGFAGWAETYAQEHDFGDLAATWVVTSFWIAFTAGRIVTSALADRVRPRAVMFAACVGSVAAASILLAGRGAEPAVWVGAVLLGLTAAPQFPVMFTYLETKTPVTGALTAWLIGGAALGGLVVPYLMGRSIDASGAAAVGVATAALSAAALAAFAAADRELRR